MNNLICPSCGSVRVHRSRRRDALEYAIAILGGGIRRCHECDSRFAKFGPSWLRMADFRKISQKLLLVVVMAGAAALIMAATLWFSHASSTPPNDAGQVMGADVTTISS